jgi:acyl-CoA reductase-like NAD-dependent aldehyde dehydrogenase
LSPITGEPIARVWLASRTDIARALTRINERATPLDGSEVFAFLKRLNEQLVAHKDALFETTVLETGFVARDAREIVDSAIEFLADFETYVSTGTAGDDVIPHSYSLSGQRAMRIISRPVGCVAAIVPQNASLTLSVIVIASALYRGNRLILRPSLQCAATGLLLGDLVAKAEPPASCIEFVNSLATDFLEACYQFPAVNLIHYIGSNEYAQSVLARAFGAGKACLVDGQGNGLLYLDETVPIDEAVALITPGATRYNGQTCTSVNGVLISEKIYRTVRSGLVDAFSDLRVGHPLDADTDVGPVFSDRQAASLQHAVRTRSRGHLLCGGRRAGAYFAPAVVEGVRINDRLAAEGFSGPMIWIAPVATDGQWAWIRNNRFPLSDAILSRDGRLIRAMTAHSRAARICVNQDPSVESMFEPWGGYPPSGSNPVSRWIEKYSQPFQLDGSVHQIMAVPPLTKR